MSGMTLAALELVLITWFKSKTPAGWKTVWAMQNAPKPDPKQITLQKRNPYIRKIGRDMFGKVDTATGSRPIVGTRELLLEFRSFGVGAIQIAEDFRTLLDDETVDDKLIAGALAVVDSGDVMNLTSLYDTQFKEVASFEFRLRTHSLRESTDGETGVGYIETVDLEVTTNYPTGSPTVENIHVDAP